MEEIRSPNSVNSLNFFPVLLILELPLKITEIRHDQRGFPLNHVGVKLADSAEFLTELAAGETRLIRRVCFESNRFEHWKRF